MFINFDKGDAWLKSVGLQREHLPHFFYKKLYKWSYDFIMTNNRKAFVCGANQIAKTSSMIRKAIFAVTSPHLWKNMFRRSPRTSWYLYPERKMMDVEWNAKWMEWMPQVPQSHPLYEWYGWEKIKDRQLFTGIRFHTGVELNFRFYSMGISSLQGTSVDDLYTDEETPEVFCKELKARLMATKGRWSSGFTATLGQQYWYDVIEKQGLPGERYPDAFKRVISLFDCLKYIDGSTGEVWPTVESIYDFIKEEIGDDEDEIKRRVFGRFIPKTGLAFQSYSYDKVSVDTVNISRGLDYFLIVDSGSGGHLGHPTGILFLGVCPQRHIIFVLSAWRGDGIPTPNNFIIKKMMEMAGSFSLQAIIYDNAAADFKLDVIDALPTIPLIGAEKKRDLGFGRVNTYLDVSAIKIPEKRPMGLPFWDREELGKLHEELRLTRRVENLSGQKVGHQVDDLTDCLRYACMHIDLPLDILHRRAAEERRRKRNRVITELPRGHAFDAKAYILRQHKYDAGQDYWCHNFNKMNDVFYR